MKVKIYITDEGHGPLIRQSAILDELRKLMPRLAVEIQTERHLDKAISLFPDATFTRKFNNVAWPRHRDGRPHLAKIRSLYVNYLERSERFIYEEAESCEADFIITDFVCEAFQVGIHRDVPVFGVAHFTWDWFFSKMFPVPLNTDVLQRMETYTRAADKLYFPPMTPQEIMEHYAENIQSVPFIVRRSSSKPLPVDVKDRMPVLLMESGAGVMRQHFQKALMQLPKIPQCHFFLPGEPPEALRDAENVTGLPLDELLIDYIPSMALVIGRAGFNTISECIAFRTPIVVLGEVANAEMNENMINLKRDGLGSFISVETFTERLGQFLDGFLRGEYGALLRDLRCHNIPNNGAEVVARAMLQRMNVPLPAAEPAPIPSPAPA